MSLQAAIEALADQPRPLGCLKMVGPGDDWRMRVGDWRVVCRIDDGRVVVIVVRAITHPAPTDQAVENEKARDEFFRHSSAQAPTSVFVKIVVA